MTEQEWIGCNNPEMILVYLRNHSTVSDWKARLIACGCCRRLWDRLDGDWQIGRDAIEVVERYVDGSASENDLRTIQQAYATTHYRSHHRLGRDDPLVPIRYLFPEGSHQFSGYSGSAAMMFAAKTARFVIRKKQRRSEYAEQASIFRDILGNPFRRVSFDPTWLTHGGAKLAQSIYDQRVFDRLPILADALEEAGCDNPEILAHCRQPGVHARGCWVVDLLLGKS